MVSNRRKIKKNLKKKKNKVSLIKEVSKLKKNDVKRDIEYEEKFIGDGEDNVGVDG